MPAWTLEYCKRCGAPIAQAATGRPRRFCSATCKQAFYRAGVTKVNRTGCKGPCEGQPIKTHRPAGEKGAERTLAGGKGTV